MEEIPLSELVEQCVAQSDMKTIKFLLPYLEVQKDSLHCTIRRPNIKRTELILYLMDIELDFQDFNGDTALHIAAEVNNIEAANMLLREHATITLRNQHGVTPMFIALERKRREMVRILLQAVDEQSKDYASPYKKYYIVIKLVAEESVDHLKIFLSINKGMDVDFKKVEGVGSPLLLAVAGGNYEVTEALLKAGANVNYRPGDSGMSALHAAIKGNRVHIVDLLLEYNANVNCHYSTRMSLITPLHSAIEAPGMISAKMLLERGALVNFSGEGQAFQSALHLAAEKNAVEKCQLLIDHGANVDGVDKNGCTPLHLAISHGNFDAIELLLANKANPDISDNKGDTPLFGIFKSLRSEQIKILKRLIHYGADVDIRNNNGASILHLAYEHSSYDIVKFLLEEGYGPDVNSEDKSGRTALAANTFFRSCNDFMMLLRHDGDINIACGLTKISNLIPWEYRPIKFDDDQFNNLNCPVYAHFEKLRLLGYNVNDLLWSKYLEMLCSNHAFEKSTIQIADFEIELKQLKTTKIYFNPQTTLYDVLLMKQNEATTICNNEEFQNLYRQNDNDFENSYPHYGWLLNLQYRRGQRRRKLMSLAVQVLKVTLGFNVPDLWTWILRYLKNEDLKQILKSKNK